MEVSMPQKWQAKMTHWRFDIIAEGQSSVVIFCKGLKCIDSEKGHNMPSTETVDNSPIPEGGSNNLKKNLQYLSYQKTKKHYISYSKNANHIINDCHAMK